ncbi:MAG TPA: beta-N-acetylhexosaminidase [Candidatus Hydrogenedentes bacterium]|nr:beta-N-acetylhexosaminidase [Candidatus Hydrogenedentota bacterium]
MMTSAILIVLLAADAGLRLIPYPKEAQIAEGVFEMDRPLEITAPSDNLWLLGTQLREECRTAGWPRPRLAAAQDKAVALRIAPPGAQTGPEPALRENAVPDEYALEIAADAIVVLGKEPAGLFHGVQTLRQLIRANRAGNGLPCVSIRDWPCALQWRAFQDDLTRGPSSTYEQLAREIALGAFFKYNMFTYYMEDQFQFRKHPEIGPVDGSLTPEEMKALVAHAAAHHIEMLGNQQSFAHFYNILAHEEFAPLAETPHILCPVKEESYALLDDMYSEVAPLLPCPFFNVCCDETDGLGTGPSKPLADQIGVGGVYVRHINRIHDILKEKYGKRMMMWGDIIIRHPEQLPDIPKDTIMLAWCYEALDHFDHWFDPFAKAGFDFFICPGVNNWGRIVPDFRKAVLNIERFVRDGVKNGAMGAIMTAWDDGARTFNAPNWHGFAWGAECAWNASVTSIETFNRRVGAVLFGEKSDRFGQAIEVLQRAYDIPLVRDKIDDAFWTDLLGGEWKIPSADAMRAEAAQLMALVEEAREHLLACQAEATANRDMLDYFLFGVARLETLARRVTGSLDAVDLYEQAGDSAAEAAKPLIDRAASLLEDISNRHKEIESDMRSLWLRENRPYAIETWTSVCRRKFVEKYAHLAESLRRLGTPLPAPRDAGLFVECATSPPIP